MNDARPNSWLYKEEIYKGAKVVYKCRKSRGLITNKQSAKKTSSADKTPQDYTYEKNTDGEKDVPTWDISPSNFDTLFDSSRYTRYLSWDKDPAFIRRITWLYPDNGVYDSRTSFSSCFHL